MPPSYGGLLLGVAGVSSSSGSARDGMVTKIDQQKIHAKESARPQLELLGAQLSPHHSIAIPTIIRMLLAIGNPLKRTLPSTSSMILSALKMNLLNISNNPVLFMYNIYLCDARNAELDFLHRLLPNLNSSLRPT